MELETLLRKCKQNNIAAQRSLYEQYAGALFLVCRRYVKTDELAEEMLMNGFLKFFRSLDQFTYVNEKATFAWLKKIMVNECLMELRRENSFIQVGVDDIPEKADDDNVLYRLDAAEIIKLVTQLPVGYRTVFNLFVLDEMTHKEIAVALGINEGTSKSQLSKARILLQQMLIKTNAEYGNRKAR